METREAIPLSKMGESAPAIASSSHATPRHAKLAVSGPGSGSGAGGGHKANEKKRKGHHPFSVPVPPSFASLTNMGLQDAENRLNRADYTNQQLQMYNKQITTSVENLSDISTQAILIAGIACASIGGESLQTVMEDEGPDFYEYRLNDLPATIFIVSSGITVMASLWIIFVSSQLIMMTRRAALIGAAAEDVYAADEILSKHMQRIRQMYGFSLLMLLISSLSMVIYNAHWYDSTIVTVFFVIFILHAMQEWKYVKNDFKTRTDMHAGLKRLNPRARDQLLSSGMMPKIRLPKLMRKDDLPSYLTRKTIKTTLAADDTTTDSEDGELDALRMAKELRHQSALYVLCATKQQPGFLKTLFGGGGSDRGSLGGAIPVSPPLTELRWAALQSGRLQWWRRPEDAMLMDAPCVKPLELTEYIVSEAVDGGNDLVILLTPVQREGKAASTQKLFYLKAKTRKETELWQRALTTATAQQM